MNSFLSASALAAALSLTIGGSGSAAIVYFASQDIPIATTNAGTSVNLQTGASGAGSLTGADANFFFGGTGISNDADSDATAPTWQPVRTATGNLDPVDNLALGITVNALSTFGTGYGGSGDPNPHLGVTFTDGTPGHIGFSLDTGSGIVYGWMEVTLNANTSEGTIHEWAFEDGGSGIVVGAVPEPGVSVLGLIALGGLALRRRR